MSKEPEYNPIKALRTKFKLTQKQLSEACFDIPIRTIQNWESGLRTPPVYMVMLITARLDQLGYLEKKNN